MPAITQMVYSTVLRWMVFMPFGTLGWSAGCLALAVSRLPSHEESSQHDAELRGVSISQSCCCDIHHGEAIVKGVASPDRCRPHRPPDAAWQRAVQAALPCS